MSKRTIIIILIVVGILGIGGYFLLNRMRESTSENLFQAPSSLTEKEEAVTGEVTYDDESGFSFEHPRAILVSDETPDDEIYYSLLTLVKEGSEMKISMKDTTYKKLDDWLAKDKEAPSGADLVGAVTLDMVSAQQYETGDQLITATIDQGVLFLIIGPKDDYWEKVQELVVSSFTIEGSEKAASSGSGTSGGNVIYEAEEVIE